MCIFIIIRALLRKSYENQWFNVQSNEEKKLLLRILCKKKRRKYDSSCLRGDIKHFWGKICFLVIKIFFWQTDTKEIIFQTPIYTIAVILCYSVLLYGIQDL